jgi:integrase
VILLRFPNGYGTVVKLSGNRRRPFAVRKTGEFSASGYPIQICIGYAATRDEGLQMLAEYNRNPYDIDAAKITFAELLEKWKDVKAPKLGKSNRSGLYSAAKHCSRLYDKRFKDIKAYMMQDCIDGCNKSYSTKNAIKNLLNHLDKYALELDITSKMYSSLLTSESIPETSRRPFTDEEVDTLWRHQDEPWVDTVLIFLYSGWRISELLEMRTDSVDLDAGTMRGGTKTEAGKNRVVPIHSKISGMVEHRARADKEYLIPCSITTYRAVWSEMMDKYGMRHTPHECRHTFETRLDSAGANRKCIDLMMGHVSKDTGNRIYNHKTLAELKYNIELIKN